MSSKITGVKVVVTYEEDGKTIDRTILEKTQKGHELFDVSLHIEEPTYATTKRYSDGERSHYKKSGLTLCHIKVIQPKQE